MKNSTLLLSAVLILLVSFFATDFGNLSGASGTSVRVDRNSQFDERTARGVGSGDVKYSDPGASGFARGGLFELCDKNKDGDVTGQDARYFKAFATAEGWDAFVLACLGVNPSLDGGILELVYGASNLCKPLGTAKTDSRLGSRDAYFKCSAITELPSTSGYGLWKEEVCRGGTKPEVVTRTAEGTQVECRPYTLPGEG